MAREPGADLPPGVFFLSKKELYHVYVFFWVLKPSSKDGALHLQLSSLLFACFTSQALAASSCQVTLKAGTKLACWMSCPHASH